MSDEQPVTSPDQHKPGPIKAARAGALICAAILLALNFGNHQGNVETLWLVGSAALLVAIVIGDVVLRRNGIKR